MHFQGRSRHTLKDAAHQHWCGGETRAHSYICKACVMFWMEIRNFTTVCRPACDLVSPYASYETLKPITIHHVTALGLHGRDRTFH